MTDMDLARELEHTLGQFLLRRNRSALYRAVLDEAPEGVDERTYSILSGLARLGPQTAAQLAEEVGIDRSGTSRHADRLENAGLLQRSPDPSDGRATLLSLTPSGQETAAILHENLARHLSSRIADLPISQTRALIAGLRILTDTPQR